MSNTALVVASVFCYEDTCHAAVAGLGSTALVLSIAAPFGGSYWYGLTALSPLAGLYYFQKGTREEECAVRSVGCLPHTQQLSPPPVHRMA